MQFKRNQVIVMLGLSVSLLVGFQNCSPASMKFSKNDLMDQSVDMQEGSDSAETSQSQPDLVPEAVVEQQVAVIEQQADEQAAVVIAASDAEPCNAPPVVVPAAPAPPQQSHGQSADHAQPSKDQPSKDPVAAIPNQESPSENEVVSIPSSEDLNRFTIIKEDAFLLACGKDITRITAVSRGARVVIVNGSLGSLTSLAKDAEVILVNSQILSSIPALRGRVIKVVEEGEKQAWLSQCAEASFAAMPSNPKPFKINMIRSEDASIVPRAASSYHITQIKSGAILESLNSLGLFQVTVLGDEVSLVVKTKDFKMTVLSKGSKLVLH